uniref:Uncharacterized protein n=1 Tax=Ammopiptanthus mongolicus TaxID=126911 RepID=A0A4P8PMF9_AMMMO|nr:hypothetical protein [Ammopiptanthus mongolicus]
MEKDIYRKCSVSERSITLRSSFEILEHKSSYRLEAFLFKLSRNIIREESSVERIWIRGLLSEVNKQRKKAFSEKASVHVRVRRRCSHFDFCRDFFGVQCTQRKVQYKNFKDPSFFSTKLVDRESKDPYRATP